MKKKTVFVGLSGGVDSAVSAAILSDAGYKVVGVFIKTWHPDFLVCNEEKERVDAMRVAAALDIPFLTFDFKDIYKKGVADYMIREYRNGRTPNPDVMCNKEVKFGAFLKKAISMGADYVATGHYARVVDFKNFAAGRFQPEGGGMARNFLKSTTLLKGIDSTKDQSYFLWTLKQEQLKNILFPVGNFKKTEVRKLAKKFDLPISEKKDSQGICFLGAVDLKDFLKHYIKQKKGKVLDIEGRVIGYHDGAVFYTLGERHGFTVTKKGPTDGAYYIVGKDVKKNILIVSQNKNSPNSNAKSDIRIENTNWISGIPSDAKSYTAQIRYHGEFLSCKLKNIKSNMSQVIFEKPILVASGQSCVVYDKDKCLGGGIIV